MTALLLFHYIVVVLVGLALGSFASALVYRVPRDIPWWKQGQRSFCPQCKTLLKPVNLIPVFSWLVQRGKCANCKTSISRTYPATEILTLLSCMGVYAALGFSWPAIILMICVPFLVALLVIDWQHLILPDQLVMICAVLGVINLGIQYLGGSDASFSHHLIGAVVFGGFAWLLSIIMSHVLGKPAMGFGDVKFFAMAGLWLGVTMISWFCILSGILGIALAFLWKRMGRGEVFPFGPALIASLYLLLIL